MGFRIGDQVVVARQFETKLAKLRRSVEEARRQRFNSYPLIELIEVYNSALGGKFQVEKIQRSLYGISVRGKTIYFPIECLDGS